MTSGTPLAAEEQQYIRDHLQDGPARIALDLGKEFSLINGGFRKRDTVKKFIRRERAGPPVVVEVPAEISRAAREKGISPEQIQFVALRAILQKVKATG
ncbi:MAG: hypothetical protein Q8R70_04965 [Methanoregula sp.]|nr:hypothetical protein [Methanoregula sp.]